jgi:1-acyl-sn-glycerol-3-phosphate acyltransferase
VLKFWVRTVFYRFRCKLLMILKFPLAMTWPANRPTNQLTVSSTRAQEGQQVQRRHHDDQTTGRQTGSRTNHHPERPCWASNISPWLAPIAYTLGSKGVLPLHFQNIEIIGLEHIPSQGSLILAPTHRSRWDSLLVASVAKQAGRQYPRFMVTADECVGIQGWLIKRLGGFPVDSRKVAIATLRHGIELLHQQETLVIFPEGDIFRTEHINPLKPGLARLALQAEQSQPYLNSQIIPISLHYDQAIPSWGTSVQIRIGKPIAVSQYDQGETLKAQAKHLTADLHAALATLAQSPSPIALAASA